ncbi:MAG: hypothetical protein IH989_04305 [Planctomycetes bacterium]|nr:hypothetical protein [Planctomycetota bacterium]
MTNRNQNESRIGFRQSRLVAASLVGGLGLFGVTMLSGCPSGDAPGANQVFMRSIRFDPPEITITVGESVTWINKDFLIPHTATSGNPGEADLGSVFRSGSLGTNQTFTHMFDTPGDFIYFCEVHPVMMRDAKVIVLPAE